jgi:hypothetical protein
MSAVDASARGTLPPVDPFKPRRPRLFGPYVRGYEAVPEAARIYMDRVLGFLGLDVDKARRLWFDSLRHGPTPTISWMPGRSWADPAQTLRHELVRYAFDDVILRPGTVLTVETPFNDPIELYFYRLVVMQGARVVILGGPATLTMGQLVGAAPDAGEPSEIEMRGADGRPGQPGARGADGQHGSHADPAGGPGHGGTQGTGGMAGGRLHDMGLRTHTLTGRVRLTVRPGAGGDGGRGGDGGDGSIGHSISLFGMGQGGDGAEGAPGGGGGDGGDGGTLRLDVRARDPGAELELDVHQGQPGRAGGGGAGGLGGIGIPDGRPGRLGPPGANGAPGRPVRIEWASLAGRPGLNGQ